MNYKVLAHRTKYFKESKAGVAIMCKAMEDMRNQTLKEGMENVAKKMLKAGKYSIEDIVDISGLSVEEVKALAANT